MRRGVKMVNNRELQQALTDPAQVSGKNVVEATSIVPFAIDEIERCVSESVLIVSCKPEQTTS